MQSLLFTAVTVGAWFVATIALAWWMAFGEHARAASEDQHIDGE